MFSLFVWFILVIVSLNNVTSTIHEDISSTYVGIYDDSSQYTWSEALDYCSMNFNTSLASIHSVDDQSYATLSRYDTSQATWIGLNDIEFEGNWTWIDNSKYDYIMTWNTNYNDNNNMNTSSNCAYYVKNSITINHANCNKKLFQFICNYEETLIETTRNGMTNDNSNSNSDQVATNVLFWPLVISLLLLCVCIVLVSCISLNCILISKRKTEMENGYRVQVAASEQIRIELTQKLEETHRYLQKLQQRDNSVTDNNDDNNDNNSNNNNNNINGNNNNNNNTNIDNGNDININDNKNDSYNNKNSNINQNKGISNNNNDEIGDYLTDFAVIGSQNNIMRAVSSESNVNNGMEFDSQPPNIATVINKSYASASTDIPGRVKKNTYASGDLSSVGPPLPQSMDESYIAKVKQFEMQQQAKSKKYKIGNPFGSRKKTKSLEPYDDKGEETMTVTLSTEMDHQ